MVMVTSMALYASPPSSVCSTPHACQTSSSTLTDYDLHPRPCSNVQKPIIGGLSCLFATPSIKHSSCLINDGLDPSSLSSSFSSGMSRRGSHNDLGGLWHAGNGENRSEEMSNAYSSSFKLREQSPVSVLQGPISCTSTPTRSPPCRIPRDRNGDSQQPLLKWEGFKMSRDGSFSTFVRSALGSCLDYEPTSFPLDVTEDLQICPPDSRRTDSSSTLDEEFTFTLEGNFLETIHGQDDAVNSFERETHLGLSELFPLDPYAEEILRDAQTRHKIFNEEFVIKAFYEAEKAHRGQVRASGDPYLTHCVETAILLATIGSSKIVVAAGLLHDTLDDTLMDFEHISHLFGKGVAELVEGRFRDYEVILKLLKSSTCSPQYIFSSVQNSGEHDLNIVRLSSLQQCCPFDMEFEVCKLSQFSKLARDNNTASKTVEADRLHTMFLAMADVRVVLIKLADRLHNMMTLGALPLQKQQRIAKETLEIFVPLSNRLGVSSWKAQLENLCFKHLNPREHRELSSKLAEGFREATIMSAIEKLDQALRKENIPYCVLSGRSKSLYSIHLKMLKKKLSIDEIHDLRGLRLIVLNEKDCYAALRIVHQLWHSVPGKQKDYIDHPKFNGYQSLHTVVCGEDMLPLEVQIRTKEMHQQAEFGFAAHWRYKESESKHSAFILQMVEWARWVLTWHSETMDMKLQLSPQDADFRPPCPFPSHKDDCPHLDKLSGPPCNEDDPIFVIMKEDEKMTVQELPPHSTVRDLLEKMSNDNSPFTSYGVPIKEELRPRLNHETVSEPNQKLKMGDLVELTPSIPDKSLTEYREEIRRMYGKTDGYSDKSNEMLGRHSKVATVSSFS
eukprot:Gb_01654 [translate_table: standard]